MIQKGGEGYMVDGRVAWTMGRGNVLPYGVHCKFEGASSCFLPQVEKYQQLALS